MRRKDRVGQLTIGMAVYEDFDGVYFTIQSLRLHHPDVPAERLKFLVVDNCPGGRHSDHIKAFVESIGGTYVASSEVKGTAIRNLIFDRADTDLVLCLDSHVLLAPGALRALLDHYDAEPSCADLLQGPLVYDNLGHIASHFKPEWSEGMYGTWALDDRALDLAGGPFAIPAQGLGLFSCRRAAWLKFNRRFSGFGGEEFYIHEKFRRAGHRALCLPALRWVHRFGRPNGTIYRNKWEDRIRNYLIGWRELGLDTTELEAHFGGIVGLALVAQIKANVRRDEKALAHVKAA